MTRALRFGYGTNGFGDHRLDDAVALLADLGYSGVALTLDHHHLDPYSPELPERVTALAKRLRNLNLDVVIETGARYLMDPWHKHEPTLVSGQGRERRIDLLLRAVRIATELGAEAVSCWSGIRPAGTTEEEAWRRLTEGCSRVLDVAAEHGVPVGFEPEPGMFVETMADYEQLLDRLGRPDALGLTLDIGHCRCVEPAPVGDCVRRGAARLVNVQIDDMRRGVHEHLEFGTGDVDIPAALSALAGVGYGGLVSVELPRHSHAAPLVAQRSLSFLRDAMEANR